MKNYKLTIKIYQGGEIYFVKVKGESLSETLASALRKYETFSETIVGIVEVAK